MADEKQLQNQATQQLTAEQRRFASVKQLLAANMKAISSVLPAHMKPERLARIITTTIQKNPKLTECTPESFIGCVLSTAALGLETDPLLGQAYLVPYWDGRNQRLVCTLIPGYKGLMKLARQSGEVATIDAHEVRIGDDFDFGYGTDPHLKHNPQKCPRIKGEDGRERPDPSWRSGEIEYFYAVSRMKDGTVQFRVMPVWEVNEIRDESQGYQYAKGKGYSDTPWISDYAEMGKKTAIRALCKMIPSSVEKDNRLQQIITADELADRGKDQSLEGLHSVDPGMITIPAEMIQDAPTPTEAEEGKRAKLDLSGGKKPVVTIQIPPGEETRK